MCNGGSCNDLKIAKGESVTVKYFVNNLPNTAPTLAPPTPWLGAHPPSFIGPENYRCTNYVLFNSFNETGKVNVNVGTMTLPINKGSNHFIIQTSKQCVPPAKHDAAGSQ